MRQLESDTRERILLVEDLPLLAHATVEILRSECANYEIEVAHTAAEVRSLALSSFVRLFVDLAIPGAQGLSLIRSIASDGHARRTCIITQHDSPHLIAEARALGVLGYIGKWESIDNFREKLRLVMLGDSVFPVTCATSTIPILSERERAVLELLQSGCDTKTCAYRLGVSDITLKRTVSDLKLRFNAKTRAQIVANALESGLLHPRATSSRP